MLGTVQVGKNTPMLVCMLVVSRLCSETHTTDRSMIDIQHFFSLYKKIRYQHKETEGIRSGMPALADCLVEFLQQRKTERINTKRALSW